MTSLPKRRTWKVCSLPARASGRRSAPKSRRCAKSLARRPGLASAVRLSPHAPTHDLEDIHQAMIEREPRNDRGFRKGWLRAMKGHLADFSTLSFKEGDKLKLAFTCRDDRQAFVLHHGRQVLHHRCQHAAGRPRPRRADPHSGRYGKRSGYTDGLRARSIRKAAACQP